MKDFFTGKLASPKAVIIVSTGRSPGYFLSLYLTSGLSSVAKIRKELLATDGKGRRVRQTGKADGGKFPVGKHGIGV